MRIVRLAQIFEQKYGLISNATPSPKEVLDRIKSDILNNYRHWVIGKYRALKILAEANEPYAKKLLDIYNDIIEHIDSHSQVQLFNRLNKVLEFIHEMKSDPKSYRNSIHDSVYVSKESDKNYREQLKSGFETNLKNISFGLEKQIKILRTLIDKEAPLAGGSIEPQRKELSKEKLRMFMLTPAAQTYGLDDMDVMTQLLSYPESRERLTTLINAIDRGHYPADSGKVILETRSIREWLNRQQATNLSALEQAPKTFDPLFEEGDESSKMNNKNIEPLIKKRDEEHAKRQEELKQKQIEEDRARHINSESAYSIFNQLLKGGL